MLLPLPSPLLEGRQKGIVQQVERYPTLRLSRAMRIASEIAEGCRRVSYGESVNATSSRAAGVPKVKYPEVLSSTRLARLHDCDRRNRPLAGGANLKLS